jgi:hypothetical protein
MNRRSSDSPTVDVFLSHASVDSRAATQVIQLVERDGLTGWIDRSNVRFGALLRNELHDAIRDSRVLVLLWSKAAFESRWVMAEILVAFHLNRFIIPCVIDRTPLPQFLGNTAYIDRQRDKSQLGAQLSRSIREAPAHANEVAPLIASRTSVVTSLANGVAAGQYGVMAAISTDLGRAATANIAVDKALRSLRKLAPLDVMVLNLSGYQCKNNYMIKHWQKIQIGRAPRDPLLLRGERYFFETLSVNPKDEGAINGIGTILFYERELQAAAFFQRRAITLAKQTGGNYEAAEQDLRLTLKFMEPKA